MTTFVVLDANMKGNLDIQVRLIDFGSVMRHPSKTRNARPHERIGYCGTVPYMPLEILLSMKGEGRCIPPLGDVWALGIVLYEMVSGIRHPFGGTEMVRGGMTSVEAKFGLEMTRTAAIEKMMPILSRCLEVDASKRASMKELSELCSTE